MKLSTILSVTSLALVVFARPNQGEQRVHGPIAEQLPNKGLFNDEDSTTIIIEGTAQVQGMILFPTLTCITTSAPYHQVNSPTYASPSTNTLSSASTHPHHIASSKGADDRSRTSSPKKSFLTTTSYATYHTAVSSASSESLSELITTTSTTYVPRFKHSTSASMALYPAGNSTSATDNQMEAASGSPRASTNGEYLKTPEEKTPTTVFKLHTLPTDMRDSSASTNTKTVTGAGATLVQGIGYWAMPAAVVAISATLNVF